jgi:four helix bundle protein
MRLKHARIAVGSLAEVGYGLHFAGRLEYFSASELADIETQVRMTAAPLHGLIAHLRRELGSPSSG